MTQAKYLKVLVLKNEEVSVDISMPIYSLKILDTIMPENVLKILTQKQINLSEIIEVVKKSDYAPQILFEEQAVVEGINKKYRVWIE